MKKTGKKAAESVLEGMLEQLRAIGSTVEALQEARTPWEDDQIERLVAARDAMKLALLALRWPGWATEGNVDGD